MSIGAGSVGLIVATLDLQLVRLVRAALQDDGPAAARAHPLGPAPSNSGGTGTVREPQPRFEPRRVIHPEPRYEPRAVYHPEPRQITIPPATASPPQPQEPCRTRSPIEPPWRVLPWKDVSTPLDAAPWPHKVKLVVYRPDTTCKGSLIDLFC